MNKSILERVTFIATIIAVIAAAGAIWVPDSNTELIENLWVTATLTFFLAAGCAIASIED